MVEKEKLKILLWFKFVISFINIFPPVNRRIKNNSQSWSTLTPSLSLVLVHTDLQFAPPSARTISRRQLQQQAKQTIINSNMIAPGNGGNPSWDSSYRSRENLAWPQIDWRTHFEHKYLPPSPHSRPPASTRVHPRPLAFPIEETFFCELKHNRNDNNHNVWTPAIWKFHCVMGNTVKIAPKIRYIWRTGWRTRRRGAGLGERGEVGACLTGRRTQSGAVASDLQQSSHGPVAGEFMGSLWVGVVYFARTGSFVTQVMYVCAERPAIHIRMRNIFMYCHKTGDISFREPRQLEQTNGNQMARDVA